MNENDRKMKKNVKLKKCQDSLYSDLLSFLLSLCTREHDTHLDVVNAQAP